MKNAHVLSEADKRSDIGREGGQKKFCPQNSKNAHFFYFQVFFFSWISPHYRSGGRRQGSCAFFGGCLTLSAYFAKSKAFLPFIPQNPMHLKYRKHIQRKYGKSGKSVCARGRRGRGRRIKAGRNRSWLYRDHLQAGFRGMFETISLFRKIKRVFTFIPQNPMHLEYRKHIQRKCGNSGKSVCGRVRVGRVRGGWGELKLGGIGADSIEIICRRLIRYI